MMSLYMQVLMKMVLKIEIGNKGQTNWLKKLGYTTQQEAMIYEYQLNDIIENSRWYLDNLEFLPEYRVSWTCYSNKIGPKRLKMATTPFKLVEKYKHL